MTRATLGILSNKNDIPHDDGSTRSKNALSDILKWNERDRYENIVQAIDLPDHATTKNALKEVFEYLQKNERERPNHMEVNPPGCTLLQNALSEVTKENTIERPLVSEVGTSDKNHSSKSSILSYRINTGFHGKSRSPSSCTLFQNALSEVTKENTIERKLIPEMDTSDKNHSSKSSIHSYRINTGFHGKSRSPINSKSKRRQSAMNRHFVSRLLGELCCNLQCNTRITLNSVMYWREQIHTLPEGEHRMNKVIEIMKLASIDIKKNDKLSLFRIDQKYICKKFFIRVILAVSPSTFSRAKAYLISGRNNVYCRINSKLTHAARGRICEGFIKAYIMSACDRDPTGRVYRMPISMTRMDLFNLYQTVHSGDHLESSAFYNILKNQFENVIFSKAQRFTKCKDCCNFRTLIENEKDSEQKSKHMEIRNIHLKEQQMEREAYYVRRSQAEMRPNEVLSIILDGMDQAKTNLPHYAYGNNPVGSGPLKLKTHITGCIVHGRGKYFWLDFNEFPHDTNLTLSCFLKIVQREAREKRLPPTLYVQLDNTCRENKNKYFLGMMAYLVKKKFVREIWVSFLLVGHTHEDIDQCFSRISVKLKPTNTINIEELHSIVEGSQLPKPSSLNIGTVWNVSGWLEGSLNAVHNVTFPKLYRIFLDETGHVTIQYKKLSHDEEWHPKPDERPLEIFKIENGQQQLPDGQPTTVVPHWDKTDIQDLRRSIEKDFKNAQFSQDHVESWRAFLQNPFSHRDESWPLFSLLEHSTTASVSTTLSEKEQQLVESYKAKRNEFKEVYTALQRSEKNDRRHYSPNAMVIFQKGKSSNVGQITAVQGDNIATLIFRKQGNKFIATNNNIKIPVSTCYPGTFKLTPNGCLPKIIKERIERENIKLD
ncbi:hypothetical protein ScPMuIL_003483 [Solemya velum]